MRAPKTLMTTSTAAAVRMEGIHKSFGALVANNAIDFTLNRGEIHALLGENGAGKTTLMRILYGLYQPDSGRIMVGGEEARIRSPRDAIACGIGMVTQHFALVPPLTVTENIILGNTRGIRLNMVEARERVAAASERFGVPVHPEALVKDLSVGERQRVEILKALFHDASVLILDEPTAVLVPQEVDRLFETLRNLVADQLSVVFISHKLHEVTTLTDRVTVLRAGELVGTVDTSDTSQADLARMMVGRETMGVENTGEAKQGPVVLDVRDVVAVDNKGLDALQGISLEVHAGEIVGLAGVSGNGQSEFAQVLEGTRPLTGGSVAVGANDLTNADPTAVMRAGVGRIPEDRHASLVGELSVAQNLALEHLDDFGERGLLDRSRIRRHAVEQIERYQIKARPDDKTRTLSGGNMQKVVLARVLERDPAFIVVSQPTRGLDVGATEYVRGKLLEQRDKGAAILLISEDLDEILALSDRIAVIYEGRILGVIAADEANPERLGLLMSGVQA